MEQKDVEAFLKILDTTWREKVWLDYRDYRILYEWDLCVSLAHHLRPFLDDHPGWRLWADFEKCDLVLGVVSPNLLDEPQNVRDVDWDHDLVQEYIAYFEVKTHDVTPKDKEKDLRKFLEAVRYPKYWSGGVKCVIFTYIDAHKGGPQNDTNTIQKLIRQISEKGAYYELRGYAYSGQQLWGLFNSQGKQFDAS